MRVVGGIAGGRRLLGPKGTRTRPTSDRVREAVFDVLGSRGAVEDASVVDLFAGTGALGIEALSRGARHAVFVDTDAEAIELVGRNLDSTGFVTRAKVVRADAVVWAAAAAGEPVDLAFCDPPYDFDRWPELLGVLRAGLAVAETLKSSLDDPRWKTVFSRGYGSTVVTLMEALPRSSGLLGP